MSNYFSNTRTFFSAFYLVNALSFIFVSISIGLDYYERPSLNTHSVLLSFGNEQLTESKHVYYQHYVLVS